MRGSQKLSRGEARYLREIYVRSVELKERVTSTTLSRAFNVKPSSVIDVVKRLCRKGLLTRKLWSHIELTEEGLRLAKEIIHHHRVIEEFYIRVVGLDPKTAHSEACKIDYIVGCEVIERLYSMIGEPGRCSHGRPFYKGVCRGGRA